MERKTGGRSGRGEGGTEITTEFNGGRRISDDKGRLGTAWEDGIKSDSDAHSERGRAVTFALQMRLRGGALVQSAVSWQPYHLQSECVAALSLQLRLFGMTVAGKTKGWRRSRCKYRCLPALSLAV